MLPRIGKKHVEVATAFTTSALGFGATGFCGLIYFTDWKVFAAYIPFYNTKFPADQPAE